MAIGNKPFQVGFLPRIPARARNPASGKFFRSQRSTQSSAGRQMAEIIRAYEQILNHLNYVTPMILMKALQPIRNKAAIYVPKKTGALMASENVEIGTNERGHTMVSLTYGDNIAFYAAFVHERVDLNHASPTRSKYLQAALEESMQDFLQRVAGDYQNVLF